MTRRILVLLLVFAVAAGAFVVLHDNDESPVRLIVLITPDTLRRDHVGVFGGGSLTPHLDAWAQGATRFDEARAPVPLTLPGHVTMLSGLPPGATGVRTNAERLPSRAERGYTLLPEHLREQGWHTAAFVSASVLGAHTGLGEAFDHYDDGALRDKGSLHVPERKGAKTVAAALAHLKGRGGSERIFIWVHLFDPHAPYERDGYAGGVRAVDDAIAPLLKAVDRPDACILIASDHGEALGDLGEPTHGVLLGDAVLRVPFLLRAPGLAAGARSDPAELADVAPTLAGAAGLSWPKADLPGVGRNLRNAASGVRPSIAESLDGHRRYRWAQLVAGSDKHGTLVDVGEGRFHWFPRAKPGEDQSGPLSPPRTPAVDVLADLIAKYKQISTPQAASGNAPRHYGGGSASGPLLKPAPNARLPDPYRVIGRAMALSRVAQSIHGAPASFRMLGGALTELGRLASVDSGNPEIAFWRGRAHERLARLAGEEGNAKRAGSESARAAQAYLRAYELGREDASTIVRAAGINAPADFQAALDLLRQLSKGRPPDCQVLVLEAKLLRDLGEDAEADAVCARARALCEAAERQRLWSGTCATGQ